MKLEYIEEKELKEAKTIMPWALHFIKSGSGYWGFDSGEAWKFWKQSVENANELEKYADMKRMAENTKNMIRTQTESKNEKQ